MLISMAGMKKKKVQNFAPMFNVKVFIAQDGQLAGQPANDDYLADSIDPNATHMDHKTQTNNTRNMINLSDKMSLGLSKHLIL